jgi:hypothetical protein
MRSWLLFPLSSLLLMAQTPPFPQKPAPGAAQPAALEDPLVVEAKHCVQKNFAILRIERVTEASTQIVAGRRVRLVCRVKEEDGEGTWEFVAFRPLQGHWRLQSANRLGD